VSTYVFKAMDVAGVKTRGEVEADSKQAVSDQLKGRGLIVLDIADKGGQRLTVDLFARVKLTELAIFTRQLATMVSSGMTILRALYVLEEQTENKLLMETVAKVRRDVEAGLALSDALERYPKVFNPLFVAMTRAGETGGVLEDALLRTADQLEKDDALRRQVRSAMVYPTVVLTVALGVLIALVTFLVPVFVGVFKQFGGNLPFITKITVEMSNLVTHSWYLIILGVGGLVWAFLRWKKSTQGRKQWDRARVKLPMKIGEIVQKIALARWSRTFSTLISAGVPILQALDITGRTAGNTVVEEAMADVVASVKRGGSLAEPLRRAPIFPSMVTHMVAVGEETGELDTMLTKIAEFYEDQVNAAVKALTSILEPVMIVFIGAMVGFIVIAMYLPLFKVYDSIR
jgi:type IV pilus assembly protein PilC